MNKKLAIATAAVGSTVILSGILGIRAVSAQEEDKGQFYERFKNRMEEFWGDDFDEEAFDERFQEFQEKREGRFEVREDLFNESELADYLDLDFDQLRELQREGTTLLEYAEANDLDPEIIAELIEAEMLEHLDDALENGRINQEEYDIKVENLEETIDKKMNGEAPPQMRKMMKFNHGGRV